MNKQLDELFKMLRSTRMVENEVEALYVNFDRIFLGLYPTFVFLVLGFSNVSNKELQGFQKKTETSSNDMRYEAVSCC